jgi:hypothetical protein
VAAASVKQAERAPPVTEEKPAKGYGNYQPQRTQGTQRSKPIPNL